MYIYSIYLSIYLSIYQSIRSSSPSGWPSFCVLTTKSFFFSIDCNQFHGLVIGGRDQQFFYAVLAKFMKCLGKKYFILSPSNNGLISILILKIYVYVYVQDIFILNKTNLFSKISRHILFPIYNIYLIRS